MMIVLGGPTASGKSALALTLAEKLIALGRPAEILCADSITVYRGFEIGAAKPSAAERARVPHHLLDLVGPDENFTAADFVAAADPIVQSLLSSRVVPIVAGGSGFYLRALLRGMAGGEEDQERSAAVKKALEARAAAEGFEALHREVLARDPGAASTVHRNDHYRIVRALQAMELSGRPWSELNRAARANPPRYEAKYFHLALTREALRARVEKRTAAMLAAGLLAEVRQLLASGVSPLAKPMQSVGYKECVEFLSGAFTEEELTNRISSSTLKLAKAQSTWFRGEELAQELAEPYLESILGGAGLAGG